MQKDFLPYSLYRRYCNFPRTYRHDNNNINNILLLYAIKPLFLVFHPNSSRNLIPNQTHAHNRRRRLYIINIYICIYVYDSLPAAASFYRESNTITTSTNFFQNYFPNLLTYLLYSTGVFTSSQRLISLYYVLSLLYSRLGLERIDV